MPQTLLQNWDAHSGMPFGSPASGLVKHAPEVAAFGAETTHCLRFSQPGLQAGLFVQLTMGWQQYESTQSMQLLPVPVGQ